MNFRSSGTVELAFDGKICADMMGRHVAKPYSSQNQLPGNPMVTCGRAIDQYETARGSTRQDSEAGINPMM